MTLFVTSIRSAPTITGERASIADLWAWLGEVPDPEIPVLSVVDLGIVRDVRRNEDDPDEVIVTITPTYSGCPATDVIGVDIQNELQRRGVARVRLSLQISPPWTTAWLTPEGARKLKAYGIAPPTEEAVDGRDSLDEFDPLAASLLTLGKGAHGPSLACPRCGSTRNETVSRFGSTPCKSLHRCLDCLEPFDHFKCH